MRPCEKPYTFWPPPDSWVMAVVWVIVISCWDLLYKTGWVGSRKAVVERKDSKGGKVKGKRNRRAEKEPAPHEDEEEAFSVANHLYQFLVFVLGPFNFLMQLRGDIEERLYDYIFRCLGNLFRAVFRGLCRAFRGLCRVFRGIRQKVAPVVGSWYFTVAPLFRRFGAKLCSVPGSICGSTCEKIRAFWVALLDKMPRRRKAKKHTQHRKKRERPVRDEETEDVSRGDRTEHVPRDDTYPRKEKAVEREHARTAAPYAGNVPIGIPTPNSYLCPITMHVMEVPMICCDGYTYEKEEIEKWFRKHDTSPLTGLQLENKNLILNRVIMDAIREWMELQNKAV